EALEAYRAARRTLLAELGIEPGPALHELERAILAQDPGLEAARRQTTPGTRPGRAAATPLAGRDEQLTLLGAGLDDALAARGRSREYRQGTRSPHPVGTGLGRRRCTRVLALEPGAPRRRAGAGAAGAGRRRGTVPLLRNRHRVFANGGRAATAADRVRRPAGRRRRLDRAARVLRDGTAGDVGARACTRTPRDRAARRARPPCNANARALEPHGSWT